MPFEEEKFEELPTEEEKLKEEELEERQEGITEEAIEEKVGGLEEEDLKKIREEIETVKEKELEIRRMDEEEKERKRKIETIKEIIRDELPEKFNDLVGNDSEEAWRKRREVAEKDPVCAAASLAGTNSEKGRTWLDKNKDSQKMWWGISRGLIGDDSEKAWQIREYLKTDERVGRLRGGRWAEFKERLGIHKSERLFNLRGKMKQLLGWYEPGDVVISTTGLDSEKAWKLREELEKIAPAETLISLAGLDSEKAQKIREKYKGDKKLEWALRKSLTGVEK